MVLSVLMSPSSPFRYKSDGIVPRDDMGALHFEAAVLPQSVQPPSEESESLGLAVQVSAAAAAAEEAPHGASAIAGVSAPVEEAEVTAAAVSGLPEVIPVEGSSYSVFSDSPHLSLAVLGLPEDSDFSASIGSLLVERRLDFEEAASSATTEEAASSATAGGEQRSPSPPPADDRLFEEASSSATVRELHSPLPPSIVDAHTLSQSNALSQTTQAVSAATTNPDLVTSPSAPHQQLIRLPPADASTSPMAPAAPPAPSSPPSPSPVVAFSSFSCSPMHPDGGLIPEEPFTSSRASSSAPPSHCDACTSPLPAPGAGYDAPVMTAAGSPAGAPLSTTSATTSPLSGNAYASSYGGPGMGAAAGRPLTASIATSPLGHSAFGTTFGPTMDAATEQQEEEEEEGEEGNWLLPEGVGLDQLLLLAEEVLGLKGAQPGQVGGKGGKRREGGKHACGEEHWGKDV